MLTFKTTRLLLFSRPTISGSAVGENVNLPISSVKAHRVMESVHTGFLAEAGRHLAIRFQKVRKHSDLTVAMQNTAHS